MKPQKRWKSEKQIMDEIDRLHARHAEKVKESEANDAKADELYKEASEAECPYGLRVDADHCRARAIRCRRTAQLIMEQKLPKMKRILAAFRTQPMAFLEDDSLVETDA